WTSVELGEYVSYSRRGADGEFLVTGDLIWLLFTGEVQAGGGLSVLAPQQRHPTLAVVAVGEVRQEQTEALVMVERGDIVGRELRQRCPVQAVEEALQRAGDAFRQRSDSRMQQRPTVQHMLIRVPEEPGLDPPRPCPCLGRGHHDRALGGGTSPSGMPLPSNFNRLTRLRLSTGAAGVPACCRSRSMRKFSTAMGDGPPDDSPNGPEPIMPGPPS